MFKNLKDVFGDELERILHDAESVNDDEFSDIPCTSAEAKENEAKENEALKIDNENQNQR